MDRPINIKTIPMKCCKCECELPSGTRCYEYNGKIYCESCFELYACEEFKKECEIEAEDYEEWS